MPLDREFIEKHQLFERYLAGALPAKGALELEEACSKDPELLSTGALADRVARAVRLLEAAGRGGDWHEKPKRWWERPVFTAALAAAALALGIVAAIYVGKSVRLGERNERLVAELASRPVTPASSRRTLLVSPNLAGPPAGSMFGLGGEAAELVELKIDLSRARSPTYRLSIDRENQGAVAVVHGALKDSNGQVRLSLNSGALGPGLHTITIDGIEWNGAVRPAGGVTFAVLAPRAGAAAATAGAPAQ
jgi:hypothetical protein